MTRHFRFTSVLLLALVTIALAPTAQATDIRALNIPPAIGDMSLGPADAKVTVIEYASASCPNCASFHRSTFDDLKAAYIDTGKIRFVMREYPHNDAGKAGFMLARCAPKTKYFTIIDRLFRTQKDWVKSPREGLLSVALETGLSEAEFDACMTDIQLAGDIDSIHDKAKSLGVRATPTFFINGEMIEGVLSFEDISARIDQLLR